MKPDEKQLKLAAKAIRENGPLPVHWDCGGDETPVIFEGWAADAYRDSLYALRNQIVSALDLPNASESSNVGQGTVCLSGGSILLKYSLIHVAYAYYDEKLPENLRPQENVSVALENYWGGDCAAYLEFEFANLKPGDTSTPAWRKRIHVTPKKDEAQLETARDYLVPFLTPLIEAGKAHRRDRSELAIDDFGLTGFYFDGRFDTASQTLNYDFDYRYEFAIEVDQDETVVLF